MVGSPLKRAKREAAEAAKAAQPPPLAIHLPDRSVTRSTRAAFHPDMLDKIIDCASIGLTLTATAAMIGVTVKTLYEWGDLHPTLGSTLARARELRQAYFETQLVDLIRRGGDSTRFGAIRAALASCNTDDWREKPQTDVSLTVNLAALVSDSLKISATTTIEAKPADKRDESST